MAAAATSSIADDDGAIDRDSEGDNADGGPLPHVGSDGPGPSSAASLSSPSSWTGMNLIRSTDDVILQAEGLISSLPSISDSPTPSSSLHSPLAPRRYFAFDEESLFHPKEENSTVASVEAGGAPARPGTESDLISEISSLAGTDSSEDAFEDASVTLFDQPTYAATEKAAALSMKASPGGGGVDADGDGKDARKSTFQLAGVGLSPTASDTVSPLPGAAGADQFLPPLLPSLSHEYESSPIPPLLTHGGMMAAAAISSIAGDDGAIDGDSEGDNAADTVSPIYYDRDRKSVVVD